MTIPAESISCQIDQHHMFGILFRIGKKRFGKLPVFANISCTSGRSGNRIYVRLTVFYPAMRFG